MQVKKYFKGSRDYLTKVLNGMAWGLFSSLLIGLIIRQIGVLINLQFLIDIGTIAQRLMGPAIGVGVAVSLGAPSLVIISSVVTGALGAGSVLMDSNGLLLINIGEPVGAFIAALIGAEIGRRVVGKTKVDIVVIPMTTIIVGGIAGNLLAPIMVSFMTIVGNFINVATELHPIPMGIIVSVLMGMILTLPISSTALAISLNLSGLAAGAATVGCAANMVGFGIASFKDNGWGGLIAQALGTSMLQIPNIIKKPIIWLPAIITSAILGPISTVIFKMHSNASGAGMGTSGLVGQFAMLEVMGNSSKILFNIALMHFFFPGIIAYLVTKFMRSKKLIVDGDMKLES